jgi:hypothetical protein
VLFRALTLAYAVPRVMNREIDPPWTFPAWSAPAFAALAILTMALPVAGWAWYAISSDDPSTFKSVNPWTALRLVFAKLVEGKDGRASTSRVQGLIWFGIGRFAYLTTYFTRWLVQAQPGEVDVPVNLMYAMGLGVGTGLLAKGITSYQANQGEEPVQRISALDTRAQWSEPFLNVGVLVDLRQNASPVEVR